jgi:High potential iron-sulfur protein
MNPTESINRRKFIQIALVGAATSAVLAQTAQAADLPPLELDNPTAKALGYIEDSSKVDPVKYPKHKPDQLCNNCNFHVGDVAAPRFGCTLFPGKSVANKGWCVSWVLKA